MERQLEAKPTVCPSLDNQLDVRWYIQGFSNETMSGWLYGSDNIEWNVNTAPYSESSYIIYLYYWNIYSVFFLVFESSDSNLLKTLMVCSSAPLVNHDAWNRRNVFTLLSLPTHNKATRIALHCYSKDSVKGDYA